MSGWSPYFICLNFQFGLGSLIFFPEKEDGEVTKVAIRTFGKRTEGKFSTKSR